jgi:hypothetical protein
MTRAAKLPVNRKRHDLVGASDQRRHVRGQGSGWASNTEAAESPLTTGSGWRNCSPGGGRGHRELKVALVIGPLLEHREDPASWYFELRVEVGPRCRPETTKRCSPRPCWCIRRSRRRVSTFQRWASPRSWMWMPSLTVAGIQPVPLSVTGVHRAGDRIDERGGPHCRASNRHDGGAAGSTGR